MSAIYEMSFLVQHHIQLPLVSMSFREIPINAARVCEGLSKIGYTPATALCDIVDNAVEAHAKRIWIRVVRDTQRADTARNNVKEYTIIDDGQGMSEDQIIGALELGSSDSDYRANSLSKFGLGLKSASFSQGERLEVISRNDVSQPFIKYSVSLATIKKMNQYGIEDKKLDRDDEKLIEEYLGNGTGTIVRVRDVRKGNHPPVKRTLDELGMKIGIIYYYFMEDYDEITDDGETITKEGLKITVDGKPREPYDSLFTKEAGNNDLDESTWDGRSVGWLHRTSTVMLDSDSKVIATIEATQLPHPPSFKPLGGSALQKEIRDKYNIGAGNNGFYVYRNKRLISWAESFDGMISTGQDMYSFRGRILLDSSADECVNIDVKKSRIHLSDEAYDAIDDYATDFKRKSIAAWGHAKVLNDPRKADAIDIANEVAASTVFPDDLPGEPDDAQTVGEKVRRGKEIVKGLKEKAKADEQQAEDPNVEKRHTAIELVDNTTDNALWEMYYDPTHGTKVKINRHHRFARLVFDELNANPEVAVVTGALLHTMVQAERHTIRSLHDIKPDTITTVLDKFRETATQYLVKTAQNVEKALREAEK